uniref:Uncharacterized protein n=1 Tax=Arundo donax TaxID=35708 RepID=A0A0A9G9Q4_ARUDO
MLILQEKEQN